MRSVNDLGKKSHVGTQNKTDQCIGDSSQEAEFQCYVSYFLERRLL